jgi:hypothetical protein
MTILEESIFDGTDTPISISNSAHRLTRWVRYTHYRWWPFRYGRDDTFRLTRPLSFIEYWFRPLLPQAHFYYWDIASTADAYFHLSRAPFPFRAAYPPRASLWLRRMRLANYCAPGYGDYNNWRRLRADAFINSLLAYTIYCRVYILALPFESIYLIE